MISKIIDIGSNPITFVVVFKYCYDFSILSLKGPVVLTGRTLALHVKCVGSNPAGSNNSSFVEVYRVVDSFLGAGLNIWLSGSLMVKQLAHNELIIGSNPIQKRLMVDGRVV